MIPATKYMANLGAFVHEFRSSFPTPVSPDALETQREAGEGETEPLTLWNRLDWQCAVNSALIAAGYSWGRSMLGPTDLARSDRAFQGGVTPAEFAHTVIMKNEREVAA